MPDKVVRIVEKVVNQRQSPEGEIYQRVDEQEAKLTANGGSSRRQRVTQRYIGEVLLWWENLSRYGCAWYISSVV
jgi:hypothetical protein